MRAVTTPDNGARQHGDGPVTAAADSCILRVEGMDCGSCAQNVDRALRSLDGVQEVRTDVIRERVAVSYTAGRLARGDLIAAVARLGYTVAEDAEPGEHLFEIEGMDCADEVRLIEKALGTIPGVTGLRFDLMGRRLTVEGQIGGSDVEGAVSRLGMKARQVGTPRAAPSRWDGRGRLVLAVLSGILWAGSIGASNLFERERLAAVLAVAAIATGGRYIVPRGVRAAMNGALDMNFLMSVAALGALLIGEYEEAASAIFLFAVAQLLESRSMDRARNAIRGLMDLSPAEATVLRHNGEERIPVENVEVGEVVLVRPGEKIAVDGVILTGRSSVNQAPITGESIPVDKAPAAEVFAGTLNGEGVLEVRSTKPASDTTLARIIHSVDEAQASRAPSQTFVDRFARVYTPAVVATAVLLAIAPPLLAGGSWGEWFYRALVLLVVACPCALVISTPVTIVSALTGGARRGILIKGGLHLENAGRARVIAFDKTGTLTEGQPSVVDIVPLNGNSPRDVLRLAAAAEARSEHPIGRALVRRAAEDRISLPPASDTTAIAGKGLRARIGDDIVHVGSERLFRELGGLDEGIREILHGHEALRRTMVLVARAPRAANGTASRPELVGIIAIADRVRPEASRALRALHEAGIQRVAMLTGDNERTARAVAESLADGGPAIDEVRAGLLPDDKVRAVRELERQYGTVLFVGDGINDAPALAAATVGIAMGSAGTDVALETADIALMGDDLSRLPVAIRLARRAEAIIRQNIAFSLVTKAVFVILAILGYATLWMAVAADMGASLLVVLNGMRVLRDGDQPVARGRPAKTELLAD